MRTLGTLLATVTLLTWLATPARAQGGLAYTVQVAALSDPESAIEQSGTLLRDGFPAYVVRAEGQAGTVFRVRVGAFGDRVSADRYARAMGERAGSTPRPALAEAIPAGILPLAPTLVAGVDRERRAVLLPWGEEEAILRIGPAGAPARYESLNDEAAFDAIWAAQAPEGRQVIDRVSLDGAAAEDPAEVRDALFRQRLRLMADRSGLALEELSRAVRGEPGSRHLIAWRTVSGAETIHGVLRPDHEPTSREPDAWLGQVPPEPPAPMLVLARPAGDPDATNADAAAPPADAADAADAAEPSDAADAAPVSGEGWTAVADGAWTVLQVGDVTWRALVGAPRAGIDDLLVVEVDGRLEVVRLLPR